MLRNAHYVHFSTFLLNNIGLKFITSQNFCSFFNQLKKLSKQFITSNIIVVLLSQYWDK